jgi:hypothetical protein
MAQVKAHYRPQPMAAGSSYQVGGIHLSGFLPTVTGTMTITDANGTVLVSALPVTAGIYVQIPLLFNTPMGGTVALTTAAGTLFI